MAGNCPQILSFCTNCGVLLPEGLGSEEHPKCQNCGKMLIDRSDRLEGVFSPLEASKITWIGFGGDEDAPD